MCFKIWVGFTFSIFIILQADLLDLQADTIFEYRDETYDVFDHCFDIFLQDSSHSMFLLAYALDPGKGIPQCALVS